MPATLSLDLDSPERVRLVFAGVLDGETAPPVWDQATRAASGVERVVLDLSALTSCDGPGLGLLTELDRIVRFASKPGSVEIVGASPDIEELLKLARMDAAPVDDTGRRGPGFISSVGLATAGVLDDLLGMVAFVGATAFALTRGLLTLTPARLTEIIRNCARVGADAVPVVSLLGALIGLILAVQAVRALELVGTVSLVPMVVGFATLREFGALISGIILAGRSGSAFAAELGTMKVTEELDAYTTFGLDPMELLVFPRIVAATIVMPLLACYAIVLGVLGGALPMFAHGYTLNAYIEAVVASVFVPDLVQALVKATVFGLLVSMLGCFYGLRTGRGADAVGSSATRAVVAGIVAILVADSLLSSIFYSLGY